MGTQKQNGLGKDFILVIIGQIISLFGNEVLRYALPLYLLNKTGSAFLFSITMATSFIPMLVLSLVGGIIADRVNKRNIMVCLDFFTAILVMGYLILYSNVNIIIVTMILLMLLYGIQGVYQPAVQASVPLLVSKQNLTSGNAFINMVNSLAGILGPVIGGITFAKYGIVSILVTSMICFSVSAVMEIFINIPHEKIKTDKGIIKVAKEDIKAGFDFITKKKVIIGKIGVLLLVINAVFSALIVVGLPIIINKTLNFEQNYANKLCGYAQGALALGGLLGGMFAGIFGKKLNVAKSARLLLFCTFTILPIGVVLSVDISAKLAYIVIFISCVVMMILSTIMVILLMTYVQMVTPTNLCGKTMAILICVNTCGHPIGNLIYGYFLEKYPSGINIIFFIAFFLAVTITLISSKLFKQLNNEDENN